MMLSRKHFYFSALLITVDGAMIVLAFLLAYRIRFSDIFMVPDRDVPSLIAYIKALFVVVPTYLLIFRSYRLYQPERHVRRIYELINVVKAITMGTIGLMALTFVYREFSYSRAVLFLSWFLSVFFCTIGRYLLIDFEYQLRKKGDRHRVLIIGMNRSAHDLIRWAKSNRHYGQDIVGVLSHGEPYEGKHFEGVDILGSVLDFDAIIKKHPVDELILADPTIPRQLAAELMLKCENKMINFKLVADFFGLMTHYVDVEYISNVPLLGLKALPLDDIWNRLVKRVFDLAVSGIGLILFLPFFLLVGLMVKLQDGGPIFYSQERVGRDGRHFMLYKFRTMKIDAEKKTGPVWTSKQDDRITSIGKFLRKSNLDELPQLWNVLLGHMSLVGPRPERPHFVEQFRDQIPRYMSRHKIKSGITGWAQIHGLRGNTSLEERIKYDLYYMENWTLMMDIEILFATLFAYRNAY